MTTENPYRIKWNNGYSFARLLFEKDNLPVSPTRIITIQTQASRVCLVGERGEGLYYVPARYVNGTWRTLTAREMRTESVDVHWQKGEDVLKQLLARQMLLQFVYSQANYYSELPTKEEVTAVVTNNPTVRGLKDSKYAYYKACVEEDPDFDGAFEIMCDIGTMLIPYRGNPNDEETTLIPEYLTFVKATDVESLFDRLGQKLDGLVGFVGNLHWSNLRNKIEGVWN